MVGKKGEKMPAVQIEGQSVTEYELVDGKIVPKRRPVAAKPEDAE